MVLWGWFTAYQYLKTKGVRRAMDPDTYARLMEADYGGWGSTIIPLCKSLAAHQSGINLSLTGLSGFTSPCPRTIVTTP